MEEIKSWETSKEDLALVEKWYKLDENAIPNEYILQPIIDQRELEQLYEDGYDSEDDLFDSDDGSSVTEGSASAEHNKEKYENLVAKGKKVWNAEESALQNILQTAARKCLNRGMLKEELARKFFQSSEYLVKDFFILKHCVMLKYETADVLNLLRYLFHMCLKPAGANTLTNPDCSLFSITNVRGYLTWLQC